MKTLKFLSVLLFTLVVSINVFSQDKKKIETDLDLNADIVSRYIWRGMNVGGAAPFVHPSVNYTISSKKHSLSLLGWGAYSLSLIINIKRLI